MRSPRPVPVPRPLAVLLVAAVGLAACGSEGGADGVDASGGTPAPAFTATELGGGELSSAGLAGTDTVLWFWAPWCSVCRGEADDVVAAAEAFDGRVRVIGVASRDDLEPMRRFVAETGTGGLTHLADPDGAVWTAYGVTSQPAYAFVDDGGRVTEVHLGPLGEAGLTERMQALAAD